VSSSRKLVMSASPVALYLSLTEPARLG